MQTVYDPRVYDPSMPIVDKFKESANYLLHLSFPQLTKYELNQAIDFSIAKYIQDHEVQVHNNYKNTTQETTLLEITNWVLEKKPIITSSGAMFERHGVMVNLIYKLLDGFINDRKAVKKEMFKYPKGSEMFTKLNLSQLLLNFRAA